MINRIIDISESGYFLRIHQLLLEIQHHGTVKITIVPEDIACLILSNSQTTLTQSVMSILTQAGTMIMVCDEKHLPSGIMFPLANHQLHTERFAAQCQVSVPLKKKLWKQVISLKIKNQSEVLKQIKGVDGGLLEMSKKVKSGDSDNLEARAAVKYFKTLFGDTFLRHREASDFNCALNYGYSVVRAIIARAVCGAGLHPSIGINHHNRYNPF